MRRIHASVSCHSFGVDIKLQVLVHYVDLFIISVSVVRRRKCGVYIGWVISTPLFAETRGFISFGASGMGWMETEMPPGMRI